VIPNLWKVAIEIKIRQQDGETTETSKGAVDAMHF